MVKVFILKNFYIYKERKKMKKIWPWILLLILLIMLCIFTKLDTIYTSLHPSEATTASNTLTSTHADISSKEKMNAKASTPTVTNVATPSKEPIAFKIDKRHDAIAIQGIFHDANQADSLLTSIPHEIYAKRLVTNENHADTEGAIPLAQRILPLFTQTFTQGFIQYNEHQFIVNGVAKSQEALDRMQSLLEGSKLHILNQTVTEETMQKEAEVAKENISMLLKSKQISFEVAKDTLTQEGTKTVNELSVILQKYPHIDIEIGGHTDSDGDADFNLQLSQKRVDSVKKALIKEGIDPARIKAIGYGETKPLVPNTTAENKQKNRRVEIHIIGE